MSQEPQGTGDAGKPSDDKEVLSPPNKQQRRRVEGISLHVKWQIGSSKTRVHCLNLQRVAGAEDLKGVQLDLLQKAFTIDRLPDHLRSQTSDFYHFSPTEECLSLPSDITDTHFRLIVHFDGWEYCVHERKIQTTKPAAERPMFVTVVEFESTALVIGHMGVRIKLISYPIISVRKVFFDEIEDRLLNDPTFKGILSS